MYPDATAVDEGLAVAVGLGVVDTVVVGTTVPLVGVAVGVIADTALSDALVVVVVAAEVLLWLEWFSMSVYMPIRTTELITTAPAVFEVCELYEDFMVRLLKFGVTFDS